MKETETVADQALDEEELARQSRRRSRNRRRIAIITLILFWTFVFNVWMKGQSAVEAFFQIIDTIADDFVGGSTVTIGVGLGIVIIFSLTKLYTQIIANLYSYRMLEELVRAEFRPGKLRSFFSKLLRFEELPEPPSPCPATVAGTLLAASLIYVMSCFYVVVFAEALFFVSWSAGVDLQLSSRDYLLWLPTLALAIPFSARVMAYVRYPYAQDYADFMPAAFFVLLLVTCLGLLFRSEQQVFFLVRVWQDPGYRLTFMRNGVFLAFIPVFFEAGFWLIQLGRSDAADK